MKKIFNRYKSRPHQLRTLDLLQASVIVLMVGSVGAYLLNSSKAATTLYPQSGHVRDQKGNPVKGVIINDCKGHTRTTDSTGRFQFSYSLYNGYCLYIAKPYPSYVSGPFVAVNKVPYATATDSYQWQVAGAWCYLNFTYCGAGKIGGDNNVLLNDVTVSEDKLDFKVQYNPPTSTPTPTPTPTPKPTPSPPSSSGGTSSGSGSSSGTGGGGGSGSTVSLYSGTTLTPARIASDKTAPSPPGSLTATVDFGHKSIALEWKESTDNVGVAGYKAERSTDNKNWEVIANNLSDTYYEDLTPSFGEINYYRVQASDAAGNGSKYATTKTTAAGFEPNVFKDQDSTVTSEDSAVTVKIPANTVDTDLFCDLRISADSLGAVVPKYRQVQGPYELSCRDSSGSTVDVLANDSIQAVVDLSKINGGKKISTAYYGQNQSGDWEQLSISSKDKKAATETIDLSGHSLFSIMTPVKSGSIWLTLLKILIVILGLIFGTLFFLRFRLKQKLETQYEDYLHQSRGF